jgi:hypothetical protein
MVEVGRRVANRAHKTMVYALIATSGMSPPAYRTYNWLVYMGLSVVGAVLTV